MTKLRKIRKIKNENGEITIEPCDGRYPCGNMKKARLRYCEIHKKYANKMIEEKLKCADYKPKKKPVSLDKWMKKQAIKQEE